MTSTVRVLAIVMIAASVSTFDYAIGRVNRTDQAILFREHRAIMSGTSPSPYRYRILAPLLIEAGTDVGAQFTDRETAFHRTVAIYDGVALILLFTTLYTYCRHWFSEERALIGVLLVACT